MTERITTNIGCATLGELIRRDFPDFDIICGSSPMDRDITHGVEIETADNTKYGYGVTVTIYPFIEWTDGSFRPCHYWGTDKYIVLHKKGGH